jgi:hypothetical protein
VQYQRNLPNTLAESVSSGDEWNGGDVLRLAEMFDRNCEASRNGPDLAEPAAPFGAPENQARRDGDAGFVVQVNGDAGRAVARDAITHPDEGPVSILFDPN